MGELSKEQLNSIGIGDEVMLEVEGEENADVDVNNDVSAFNLDVGDIGTPEDTEEIC